MYIFTYVFQAYVIVHKKYIDNNKKRNVFKKCENTPLTIYVELHQPV